VRRLFAAYPVALSFAAVFFVGGLGAMLWGLILVASAGPPGVLFSRGSLPAVALAAIALTLSPPHPRTWPSDSWLRGTSASNRLLALLNAVSVLPASSFAYCLMLWQLSCSTAPAWQVLLVGSASLALPLYAASRGRAAAHSQVANAAGISTAMMFLVFSPNPWPDNSVPPWFWLGFAVLIGLSIAWNHRPARSPAAPPPKKPGWWVRWAAVPLIGGCLAFAWFMHQLDLPPEIAQIGPVKLTAAPIVLVWTFAMMTAITGAGASLEKAAINRYYVLRPESMLRLQLARAWDSGGSVCVPIAVSTLLVALASLPLNTLGGWLGVFVLTGVIGSQPFLFALGMSPPAGRRIGFVGGIARFLGSPPSLAALIVALVWPERAGAWLVINTLLCMSWVISLAYNGLRWRYVPLR